MPTITTTEAFIVDGVATTALEQRLYDTAMFLGDGSANGVRGGICYHGATSLGVSVNGSDQVTVQAGACVIPAATGQGVYRGTLAAATSAVALTARNSTNPRIDLIVAQATGTNVTIKTIDGTPAASPSAPALPAQHIELARATVPQVAGGAVTVDSTWRTFASAIGGVMLTPTAARLTASGNITGQRATALDTGIDYRWSGTAWAVQKTSGSVTAAAGVTSSATKAFIRGDVAHVNVNAITTSALVADATLFTLTAGYLPPETIFGNLSTVSGTVIPCYAEAGGAVKTSVAISTATTFRGQIVIPLP